MRLYMNTALVNLHRKMHVVMQSEVRAVVDGMLRREYAITTITTRETATTVMRYIGRSKEKLT